MLIFLSGFPGRDVFFQKIIIDGVFQYPGTDLSGGSELVIIQFQALFKELQGLVRFISDIMVPGQVKIYDGNIESITVRIF